MFSKYSFFSLLQFLMIVLVIVSDLVPFFWQWLVYVHMLLLDRIIILHRFEHKDHVFSWRYLHQTGQIIILILEKELCLH